MAHIKDPKEFWDSPTGKKVLAEEKEKTFAGEPSTVTVDMVERVFKKYKELMESTEWNKS